jgi:hypothetical protein
VGNGAVGAIPGTDVAEDHESGGAVLPALADIGAVSFLADRVEVELTHQILQPEVVTPPRGLDLEPGWLSIGQRLNAMSAADLVKRFAHFSLSEANLRGEI